MSRTVSELVTGFAGPASEPGVSRERYQVSDRDGRFVQLTRSDAEDIARALMADMGAVARARCPGCGDNADAAHMAVCGVIRRDRLRMDGWLAGAMYVISLARTQMGRRGTVDVAKLVESVEALYVNGDDGRR